MARKRKKKKRKKEDEEEEEDEEEKRELASPASKSEEDVGLMLGRQTQKAAYWYSLHRSPPQLSLSFSFYVSQALAHKLVGSKAHLGVYPPFDWPLGRWQHPSLDGNQTSSSGGRLCLPLLRSGNCEQGDAEVPQHPPDAHWQYMCL